MTNPTYITIKREKCDLCLGSRLNGSYMTPESWEAVRNGSATVPISSLGEGSISCKKCDARGYVDTEVDLTEALDGLGVSRFRHTIHEKAVVHLLPLSGEYNMQCCGSTSIQLPGIDRFTSDPAYVTCEYVHGGRAKQL